MAKAFVLLQYLLPRHWLTAIIWRIARIRHPGTKNFLITKFASAFDVDLEEVKLDVPGDFATFNDFFIRELADNSIFQAKGIDYSLGDLLATDMDEAEHYIDGCFATIYLAPYNYHRVHAPLAGELVGARYVPGDLFSVNEATVANLDGLFRRNERLVMHFRTPQGPAVLIFVGALNVGSISTPWTGEIRPRKAGVVDVLELSAHPTAVEKGDLLGWFNMGSTVILLFPKGVCEWDDDLEPGETLKMGVEIGELKSAAG
jgi:phosphatidylserine decarboxylase